jgi:dienelactone hydrolase
MRYIFRTLQRFSLDHSSLKPEVTSSGLRNFKIASAPAIEGYLTKNGTSKGKMHTVVMIHEWWGFNQSITQTAEIFSSQNIRVFVPDLYRGEAANSAEVNPPLCRKPAIR